MSAREKLLDFLVAYGGFCRDCADECGICPQTGIGCGERRKASEFILRALEYGSKHGHTAGYTITSPEERDAVRGDVLEEAARVAEKRRPATQDWTHSQICEALNGVAAAIRRLKETSDV